MLHQHHSLEQERPLTPSAPPPQLRVRLRCVAPHPLRLVIHAVSLHTDYGAETGTRSPAMMIAPLGGGAAGVGPTGADLHVQKRWPEFGVGSRSGVGSARAGGRMPASGEIRSRSRVSVSNPRGARIVRVDRRPNDPPRPVPGGLGMTTFSVIEGAHRASAS